MEKLRTENEKKANFSVEDFALLREQNLDLAEKLAEHELQYQQLTSQKDSQQKNFQMVIATMKEKLVSANSQC